MSASNLSENFHAAKVAGTEDAGEGEDLVFMVQERFNGGGLRRNVAGTRKNRTTNKKRNNYFVKMPRKSKIPQ